MPSNPTSELLRPPTPALRRTARQAAACGLLPLSGLVLGLACLQFHPALAWVALYLWGLGVAVGGVAPRAYYAGALLGGVAFYLVGFSWLPRCFAGDGLYGPYTAAWLVIGLLGGLTFMVIVWWVRRLTIQLALPLTIGMPLCWVSYEWMRFAVGAVFDETGFPWLRIGPTQVDNLRLIQVADIGGEYLIAFLVAVGAGVLCDLTLWLADRHRTRVRWLAAGCGGGLLLAAWSYGESRLEQFAPERLAGAGRGPTIALMSTDDLPPFVTESLAVRARRSAALYVWPELAWHHDVSAGADSDSSAGQSPEYQRHLETAAKQLDGSLLLGCRRIAEDGRTFNCLAYQDRVRNYRGSYDKRWLVPWTEFSPWTAKFVGHEAKTEYQPGTNWRVFRLGERGGAAWPFACAVCYDIVFADVFRDPLRHSAVPPEFFVHCGSEGQDPTGTLSAVLLAIARLRAVEIRRPLVRHAFNGWSGWIDSRGAIAETAADGDVVGPLPLGSGNRSCFVAWGNWLPVLTTMLTALLLAASFASLKGARFLCRLPCGR